MLTERELERYAEVLLWGLRTARRRRFRKNDVVAIRFDAPALRLAEILYGKILAAGMHPVPRLNPTTAMETMLFHEAGPRQISFTAPGDKELFRNLHGSIFLHAPESLTHLADVDPKRIAGAMAARKYVRDILAEREAAGDLGWTLCMLPTEALAKHAGMTIKDYSGEIARACFLNRIDPVARWQEIFERAGEIKKWLNRMKIDTLRIESKGTDLTVKMGEKRKWIGISGRNIPSFEIFVSPDGRGTRGVYYADQPSFRSGNRVERVRLEFRDGRVIRADAVRGGDFLRSQIAMDPGACRIGEFSLTDIRFSRIRRFMANTLFDENFGGRLGNCHVALGAAYATSYRGAARDLTPALKKKLGLNDSALHWDLVNTEKKRVTARLVSGKSVCIYENGKFCR